MTKVIYGLILIFSVNIISAQNTVGLIDYNITQSFQGYTPLIST